MWPNLSLRGIIYQQNECIWTKLNSVKLICICTCHEGGGFSTKRCLRWLHRLHILNVNTRPQRSGFKLMTFELTGLPAQTCGVVTFIRINIQWIQFAAPSIQAINKAAISKFVKLAFSNPFILLLLLRCRAVQCSIKRRVSWSLAPSKTVVCTMTGKRVKAVTTLRWWCGGSAQSSASRSNTREATSKAISARSAVYRKSTAVTRWPVGKRWCTWRRYSLSDKLQTTAFERVSKTFQICPFPMLDQSNIPPIAKRQLKLATLCFAPFAGNYPRL